MVLENSLELVAASGGDYIWWRSTTVTGDWPLTTVG
jgi:hypothetical protein